ncbi:MAG: hypothetical protein ACXAC7_13165 [Candidatus Hodarchaeales archaeon]|jgi:hypothetical protein
MIRLICSLMVFITGFFYFLLAWRILNVRRNVKEDFIFHLVFLSIVFGFIAFGFIIVLIVVNPNDPIDLSSLFILGIFYDLFYLELSFFYLSLFPNSSRFFEKYLPFFIGGVTFLNAIIGTSNVDYYFIIGWIFHVIVIGTGLFLLFETYRNLKKGKQFIQKKEEIVLISYLEKIVLLIIIVLIFDGLGFLFWHFLAVNNHVISDVEWAFYSIIFLLITIGIFQLVMSIGDKTKNCDISFILNNVS